MIHIHLFFCLKETFIHLWYNLWLNVEFVVSSDVMLKFNCKEVIILTIR